MPGFRWYDEALEGTGRAYAMAAAGAFAATGAVTGGIAAAVTGAAPVLAVILICGPIAYAGVLVGWFGWLGVRDSKRHHAAMDGYRASITEGFERLLAERTDGQ